MSTVKEEIFVGEKISYFSVQSVSYGNLISYSEIDQKKGKIRRDDRKVCKRGGRKFGMEINFVHFQL